MIKKLITDSIELEIYRSEISKLFSLCFNEKLDQELWTWAFLENPTGFPIVALAFDEDVLIGHYAMIPMPFTQGDQKIRGYLSMTTMVHPNYRKFGLFVDLATMVYSRAESNSFVYGFPNSNSMPGFKNRLSWSIWKDYCIATIKSDSLRKIEKDINYLNVSILELDLTAENFLSWRLAKPGANYVKSQNLIYKKYQGSIDVLKILENETRGEYFEKLTYNVLTNSATLLESADHVQQYYFGYRSFGADINEENFTPELLMSDVF